MLDVLNASSTSGQNVDVYTSNSCNAQKFMWGYTSTSGQYAILTVCSDEACALDVAGAKTADGTNVLQYTSKGSANQLWVFESTTAPSSSSSSSSSLSTDSGTSYGWNFKTSAFRSLGTISSTTTVNNLTLNATSEKTMAVVSDEATINGTSFTYSLQLGGSGNTSYRNVKIPVGSSATITVYFRSGDTSKRRTLKFNDGTSALGTISGSTATCESITVSSSTGYVYMYSTNSSMNIYKVNVVNN